MLCTLNLNAKIWYVVQGSAIPDPKAASALAQDGDTVDIAYAFAPYTAYETKWPQNNLLIRGSGGQPILKANANSVTQKAIFVTQGNDITVENIAFIDCTVPDLNGAGIRSEGVNLTVRACKFANNENGILAGDKANCQILVEYCVFSQNGHGDGYSHNIYINHIQKFIFRHNYTHDCKVGHLIKSRAFETYILYNRIDSPDGFNPSREIDLPNGGLAIIIGNVIRQTLNAENSNIIGYGLEGLSNPAPNSIYLINNTLINEKSNGSFVQLQAGTETFKAYNNIIAGGGSFLSGSSPGTLDTLTNLRTTDISSVGFQDPINLDYHLKTSSIAVNKGTIPGIAGTYDLTPTFEYVSIASTKPRTNYYPLDLGAFESEVTTGISSYYEDLNHIKVIKNSIELSGIPNNTTCLITDLKGNLLIKKEVVSDNIIQLNGLYDGIYVISLLSNNKLIETKKIAICNKD